MKIEVTEISFISGDISITTNVQLLSQIIAHRQYSKVIKWVLLSLDPTPSNSHPMEKLEDSVAAVALAPATIAATTTTTTTTTTVATTSASATAFATSHTYPWRIPVVHISAYVFLILQRYKFAIAHSCKFFYWMYKEGCICYFSISLDKMQYMLHIWQIRHVNQRWLVNLCLFIKY